MRKYIMKKLLGLIPTFIGIMIIFSLFFTALPGDTLSIQIGMPAKEKQRIRHELHLDQPKVVQLGYWLKGILKGDLGTSHSSGAPIAPTIKGVIKASFPMYIICFVLSLAIAIPLGVISAYKHGRIIDKVISSFSMIGISIPEFMIAVLLMRIIAYNFEILPRPSQLSMDIAVAGGYTFMLKIKYAILPALSLIICTIPGYIKYTRSGMLQVIREDYIKTARSKGVKERVVIYKHALKNTVSSIMSYASTSIPTFIAATMFIEVIYGRPGLGNLLLNGVFTRDYPLIMAVNLVITLIILFCNFTADILYGVLDPRIKV